jgi:hypothetical protein
MKMLFTKMVDLVNIIKKELDGVENIKAKFDCKNQIAFLYKEGDVDKYIYLDLREDLSIPYLKYEYFKEFIEDFGGNNDSFIYGIDNDCYYLEANEDKEELKNSVKTTINALKKLVKKALKKLEEEE